MPSVNSSHRPDLNPGPGPGPGPRVSLREGAARIPPEQVGDLHTCDRSPAFKMAGDTAAFALASVVAVLAWNSGSYLLVAAALLVAGHFGHIVPLMFHDASHGTLHPVKWMNEALGFFLGLVTLVPLTAYRHAHALHHRYPGTERDPELWPYTMPGTPRSVRIACVPVEIVLGSIFTPILFLRAVLMADDLSPDQKRRIRIEYAIAVLYWGLAVISAAMLGLWTPFLVGVVAPWMVAGMFQTVNKYVEHMGMLGSGILDSTRSVLDNRLPGRMLSASMQHVDHHGAHHLYAKIPHYHLPQATPLVMTEEAETASLYPSYFSAFVAMLRTLGDPRVGAQWIAEGSDTPDAWDSRGETDSERHDSRDAHSREQVTNQRI
mgnify:CR=1 FL=1